MNRIEKAFESLRRQGRRGLLPYVTAGYPDLETTEAILTELGKLGVAVAEVGGHDQWREAELALVTVGRDKAVVDREIEAITRFLDGDGRFEVVERDVEYF